MWLTAEKTLSKKVVQMSRTLQDACGFKVGDDLVLSAGGSLKTAESIILRDVTAQEHEPVPELGAGDKPHWAWYLREHLGGYILLT